MSIPFILICGFLGSGKTTLLKRIIDKYSAIMRLAIVQNEFSDTSVDARDLEITGKKYELLEINGGSVFCVCLFSDFVNKLFEMIQKTKPDAVVLEASGLADPIAVAQLISTSKLANLLYLNQVYCIVDATTFIPMCSQLCRVSHQVRVADTVVINKTDLGRSNVESVRSLINQINPFARVVEVVRCQIDLSDLFKNVTHRIVALGQNEKNLLTTEGRPNVGSAIVKCNELVTLETVKAFCAEAEKICWRIKGHIRLTTGECISVQSWLGFTEYKKILNFTHPSELVCIGPNATQQTIDLAFKKAVETTVKL